MVWEPEDTETHAYTRTNKLHTQTPDQLSLELEPVTFLLLVVTTSNHLFRLSCEDHSNLL